MTTRVYGILTEQTMLMLPSAMSMEEALVWCFSVFPVSRCWYLQYIATHTVDGRNPAPVDRWFLPLFIGCQPSFWWCRISQPSTVTHQCSSGTSGTSEFDRFSQLKWANYLEHMDPKRKSVEHLMVDTRKSKSLPGPNWNTEFPCSANQASFTRKLKVFLKIRSLPTK